MAKLKSSSEIQQMKKAGDLLASCHKKLRTFIKEGVTTLEIDRFVEEYLLSFGARPEQKGFMGYPFATCASVNDCVCHGLPNAAALKDGDIVTIDFVVNLDGWLADSAWSYAVGNISTRANALLDSAKGALYAGIEKAQPGNRIGDISSAVQEYAERRGYSVVTEYVGHGIGQTLHESPPVPHWGMPGSGPLLEEGMVITIEPMLNIGFPYVRLERDGWTVRTVDGSLSAQYEHTVAISKNGPLILTEQS
ncbi:type I methionyl aminopeptidase [Fictibacillus aquaticus]|uniref:Methionine aminopeptidase n=1 Tax=Fictibacillus aquaticus TaxID=2021314 RepID=A0A235FER8_9BACL|nr:type I methionyl aminopeptidase [Fictibacillus aquaticus]OYD59821.1 type I methionyl aminopeptidase [Fictibacillus aquaticus]